MEARQALFEAANPGLQETGYKKEQRRAADRAAYQEFTQWLSHWQSRISEWPIASKGSDE